jgi:serine/threonine protein kinase
MDLSLFAQSRVPTLGSEAKSRRIQFVNATAQLVTSADGTPVELGRGAMGVTYKAFDVDRHCPVTLKVISGRYLGDESARFRFFTRSPCGGERSPPECCLGFPLRQNRQNYFYAMEFVEGETLENIIRRCGKVDVKLALEIVT